MQHNVYWQIFQGLVALGFVFANIYFEWEIGGLAAGVMGGMLAYYMTGVVNGVIIAAGKRHWIEEPAQSAPPPQARSAYQEWVALGRPGYRDTSDRP